MGHQLWTSPITGYRRKGTRISELRSLLGSGITALAILEPLKSCRSSEAAVNMASELQRREFDVAGVKDDEKAPVKGFVITSELTDGTIQDHIHACEPQHLVSEAIPLHELLSVLKTRTYVFVVLGSEIRGIVTRTDLNKPPVRIYLFGIISLFEMHLTFWLRIIMSGKQIEECISEKRLAGAMQLQGERAKRNEHVDLIECLQLCDKRDIVVGDDRTRELLGMGNKGQATEKIRELEDLRNRLAHSQQDLSQSSKWETIIELVEWVERTVETSDARVEEEARHQSGETADKLLGSL